ncbi:hypothetical protein T439DRAFT_359496 [Meredithblackwellia eburnea MCA 4105]
MGRSGYLVNHQIRSGPPRPMVGRRAVVTNHLGSVMPASRAQTSFNETDVKKDLDDACNSETIITWKWLNEAFGEQDESEVASLIKHIAEAVKEKESNKKVENEEVAPPNQFGTPVGPRSQS